MLQNDDSVPAEPGAHLAEESAAWQTLLNLLEEETRALINGEADRLAPLNASKLSQLEALGELARVRHAGLRAAGYSTDHAGMADWLAKQRQPEYLTFWQRLCEMEQQAQVMNQRIGILIDLRLSSTRQALNVLVQTATRQDGLYDQAGQSVGAGKGKRIIAV